jgi:hypothetical protein
MIADNQGHPGSVVASTARSDTAILYVPTNVAEEIPANVR